MSFTCTTCDRPLYNRRRVTCEFCGSTIPSTLRLNSTQTAAIERLKIAEAKEHREFIRKGLPLRTQRQPEACVF